MKISKTFMILLLCLSQGAAACAMERPAEDEAGSGFSRDGAGIDEDAEASTEEEEIETTEFDHELFEAELAFLKQKKHKTDMIALGHAAVTAHAPTVQAWLREQEDYLDFDGKDIAWALKLKPGRHTPWLMLAITMDSKGKKTVRITLTTDFPTRLFEGAEESRALSEVVSIDPYDAFYILRTACFKQYNPIKHKI